MSDNAPSRAAAGAPVVARTEAVWLGEYRFAAGPEGRRHLIDAGANDEQRAPGPVETLLNAVATCSAIDVLDILAKRRTPVERMRVLVTAERRSEHPRRVQRLAIEYRIDGAGIDPDQAHRAMQLSFERYCSVAASLAPDIVTEARLTLNGTEYPPVRQQVWSAAGDDGSSSVA